MNFLQLTSGLFINLDKVIVMEKILASGFSLVNKRPYSPGHVLLFFGLDNHKCEVLELVGENAEFIMARFDEFRSKEV